MGYNINMDLFRMAATEPFYSAVSRKIIKIADENISTACVFFDKNRGDFMMRYNPNFMARFEEKERIAIIEHEILHVVCQHITTQVPPDVTSMNSNAGKIFNWAADAVVNSALYDKIPRQLDPNNPNIRPIIPGEGPLKDYPRDRSFQWYYEKMTRDKNVQESLSSCSGENGETIDDHSEWENEGKEDLEGEVGSSSQGMAAARAEQILTEAVNEATVNGWGSIPQSMKGEIEKSISRQVDWRRVFRYFVGSRIKAEKYATWHMVNRRLPDDAPGYSYRKHAIFLVAVDQSGSMSDQVISLIFGEMGNMATIASFDVVYFDTAVDESSLFHWKKGDKIKGKRTRCGGTDFQPISDFADRNKYDGLIIATDMIAPQPKKSRTRRLWLATTDYRGWTLREPVVNVR